MTAAESILAILDESTKKAEAATEGPWVNNNPTYIIRSGAVIRIAEMLTMTSHERDSDGAFISSARTDLPRRDEALKVAVEALQNSSGMHNCPHANNALQKIAEILEGS